MQHDKKSAGSSALPSVKCADASGPDRAATDLTARARELAEGLTPAQRDGLDGLADLPDHRLYGFDRATSVVWTRGHYWRRRKDTNTMCSLRGRGLTTELDSMEGHWRATDLGRAVAAVLAGKAGGL